MAGVIQRRVSLISQPTSTPTADPRRRFLGIKSGSALEKLITEICSNHKSPLPERGRRAKKGVVLGNEVKVEIKCSGTMGSNLGMKGSEVHVSDFSLFQAGGVGKSV